MIYKGDAGYCVVFWRWGLHDNVESSMISDTVVDRFGELVVIPVEWERGWRVVGIERGVRAYVVGHEVHRRCFMKKGSLVSRTALSWRGMKRRGLTEIRG
jgi:hypothetical protein